MRLFRRPSVPTTQAHPDRRPSRFSVSGRSTHSVVSTLTHRRSLLAFSAIPSRTWLEDPASLPFFRLRDADDHRKAYASDASPGIILPLDPPTPLAIPFPPPCHHRADCPLLFDHYPPYTATCATISTNPHRFFNELGRDTHDIRPLSAPVSTLVATGRKFSSEDTFLMNARCTHVGNSSRQRVPFAKMGLETGASVVVAGEIGAKR